MNVSEFAGSRRLIVCCDGTGQKVDHRRSNVVRLYDALDRANPAEQVDFYHPGVGTRPSEEALTRLTQTLVRWAGSTAGYGLLDVVAQAYGFVVDNYRPGDAIYLIGFSRGALAARLLGGVLHRIGVLSPGAKDMYLYGFELYEKHLTLMPNLSERHRHDDLVREFRTMFCMPGPVCLKFLGIWDTVKAFGIFAPRSFPHLRHNESVQAVSTPLRSMNVAARSCLPVGAGCGTTTKPVLRRVRPSRKCGSLACTPMSVGVTEKTKAASPGTPSGGWWAKPSTPG